MSIDNQCAGNDEPDSQAAMLVGVIVLLWVVGYLLGNGAQPSVADSKTIPSQFHGDASTIVAY